MRSLGHRCRLVLIYLGIGLLVAALAVSWAEAAGSASWLVTGNLPSGVLLLIAALGPLALAWREPLARHMIGLVAGTVIVFLGGRVVVNHLLREPPPVDHSVLPAPLRGLASLHVPLAKPEEGDWLDVHLELGQSYDAYLVDVRGRRDAARRVIYVQPLGDFTPPQERILQRTAEFLGIFYQLPVRVCDPLPLTDVPAEAQRRREGADKPQILTDYITSRELRPRLPDDAAALLACTAEDLWPGGNWGCVYGHAEPGERVAVWSLFRNGDPAEGPEAYRLALLRSLKTASHETGHLFGMLHCVYHECDMCGANHREEADRHPLWLCPSCLAKLCDATGADPARRFEQLAAFAEVEGLVAEATFWRRSLALVQSAQESGGGSQPRGTQKVP